MRFLPSYGSCVNPRIGSSTSLGSVVALDDAIYSHRVRTGVGHTVLEGLRLRDGSGWCRKEWSTGALAPVRGRQARILENAFRDWQRAMTFRQVAP